MKIDKEYIKNILSKFNDRLSIIDNRENYGYRDYINILCSKHGEYAIRYDHLIDYGCSKCSKENKNIIKQENFINRSKLLHNNKYLYDKVIYVNNRKKVIINCVIHGDFLMSPFNHYTSKQGCKYCNYKLTTEEFISRSKVIHKERYNYDKSFYINDKNKIEIICDLHGSFFQRPSSHFAGNGCPSCKESLGEKIISNFFDINHIKYDRQRSFDGCRNKLKLKFDFYLPDINILIEYDGIQHYKPIDFFGGTNRFNYEINLQKIKNEFCLKNKIKLIRISYKEDLIKVLSDYFPPKMSTTTANL